MHDARGTRVWAASDMETFSCWSNEVCASLLHRHSSMRLISDCQLDQMLSMDIRSPSLHDHGHSWVTDYLIKGHCTQKAENELGVFVGSNEFVSVPSLAKISIQLHLSGETWPW
jgi:hypothetical protein